MNMKVSYLSLPDDCTAEQEFEAIWATRKATDAVVSKCIAELDKELDELELEGNDYATNDPVYWLRNITEALRTWRKANPVPIGLDTSEVQPRDRTKKNGTCGAARPPNKQADQTNK